MTASSPPTPWPKVGLSLALGLSVAETGLVFRNLLRGFKAGGVLGHVALAACVYALILGTLDTLAARRGLNPVERLGLCLLTVAAFGWMSNQPLFSLSLVMLAAGLFSLLAQSRAWPLAGILWGLAWWPARPQAEPPRPPMLTPAAQGPNLAVIVLDTLVRDRCATYGYDKPTSPNLDGLARRGVLMERAWSTANWSLPAHASLFSARLPHDHGTNQREGYTLPADTLLAERLRLAGYETAGLSANPFAGLGSGLAQGFTHFEPFWRDFTAGETLFAARVLNGLTGRDRDKGGAAIVSALDDWLSARDPARSFFLFVNLMEAHGPYQEVPLAQRAAFIDAPLRALEAAGEAGHMAQIFGVGVPDPHVPVNDALLDGCTLAADHLLGEVMRRLPENTVIIALSDHGDMMGEQGFYGHNTGLYEPIVNIAWVMAGPGLPVGRRLAAPVSIADVAPTALALLGLPTFEGVFGLDLGPAIRGELDLGGRLVYAEHPSPIYTTSGWRTRRPWHDWSDVLAARSAVTDGVQKRVVHADGRDWAFDLGADPGERRPGDGAASGLPRPEVLE